MGRPVKVAIVGCGNISQFHLRGYSGAGATIAGVVDPNKARGMAMAEQSGAPWFKTVDDLLNTTEIDAASVTVPNFLHLDVCTQLLEANVAVLCEKTLAANVRDSKALVDEVRKSGGRFQMGFMKRFHPSMKKFVEFASRIGQIEGGHLKCFQPMTKWPQKSWLFTKAKGGGGILLHGGSHTLDLLFWAMGEAPVSVDARVRKEKGANVEHYASGLLEFSSGTVTFEAAWLPHTASGDFGSGWDEKITLRGKLGIAELTLPVWHLSASMSASAQLYSERTRRRKLFEPPPVDYFTQEIKQFVRSVRDGTELWPTVQDGYVVDCVVHGAYESARTKLPVSLRRQISQRAKSKGGTE